MANWLNNTFKSADYNVAKFFSNLQDFGGKPMTCFWEFISFLGAGGIIMILIALTLCIFPKTRKFGVTSLFAIAIGALITSIILKPLVERTRPYTNLDSNYFLWWKQAGKNVEGDYSFPSGHTTASMAFALSIFLCSRKKKFTFFVLLFPILMASSRIYLMVHYFSDCLFAILVGSFASGLAYLITYLLFNKTKGKFNNFVNNFKIQDLFNKNKKSSINTDEQ